MEHQAGERAAGQAGTNVGCTTVRSDEAESGQLDMLIGSPVRRRLVSAQDHRLCCTLLGTVMFIVVIRAQTDFLKGHRNNFSD